MINDSCIRTIKVDITHLLTAEQMDVIKTTISDAIIVSKIFTELGIEHRSTSYTTMHKYGYEMARERCPCMNTAILQQTAKVALFNIKS